MPPSLIPPFDALDLRRRILRPEAVSDDAVRYPEERFETTATYGIEVDGVLVSVGTIMRSPYPGSGDEPAWRIRGMATEPPFRSRGFGGQILEALLCHARDGGGGRVWCNARVDAVPFYERFGFATRGDVFLTAGDRPHVLMYLDRQQS
ncbi:MAG: GNAT family N-acetyltransferase [Acidimicrobiia bacterium]|nr:GNAT family N-acetyltransferase [Acidimicrobiia bacterium]